MGVFLANSPSRLWTSDTIDWNNQYTISCWFKLEDIGVSYNTIFAVDLDGTSAWDLCFVDAFGQVGVSLSDSVNADAIPGLAIDPSLWGHVAMVRESSTLLKLYYNGELVGSSAFDCNTLRTGFSANRLEFGGVLSANIFPMVLGGISNPKVWNTSLTIEEVRNEMWRARPQYKHSTLHSWLPTKPGARTENYGYSTTAWTDVGLADYEDPPIVMAGGLRTLSYVPLSTRPPNKAWFGTDRYRNPLRARGLNFGPSQNEALRILEQRTVFGPSVNLRDKTSIPSAEAFGLLSLRQEIQPGDIASAEAFGTLALRQEIDPTSITSAESVGTPILRQEVNPGNVASAEAFGTLMLRSEIDPSSIASAESVPSPTVFQHTLGLSISNAGDIASAEAFGTVMLRQEINPGGITSAEAIGTDVLRQEINPGGITSAEVLGSPMLRQEIQPGGIASAESIGSDALRQEINPGGITSAESIGIFMLRMEINFLGDIAAPAPPIGVEDLRQEISFSSIASAESVSSPSLRLEVQPGGIASAQAFGTLALRQEINAGGVPSSEAVPAPLLHTGKQIVFESINGSEVVSSPSLKLKVFALGSILSEEYVPKIIVVRGLPPAPKSRLSQRQRVTNTIQQIVKTLQYSKVSYDSATGLAQVVGVESPTSVLVNELTCRFEVDKIWKRSYRRARKSWAWTARVDFASEVAPLDVLRPAYKHPVRLPRDPDTDLDQVAIRLVSCKVAHPHQQDSLFGTSLEMSFDVEQL